MDTNLLPEIKKLLRLRMNGEVSTNMRNKGVNYKTNFGLDSVSIREIAQRYNPDRVLAEKLWSESSRECKILATLIYPKSEFTSEKADEWIENCFTTELVEQLCFNLLQHLTFASDKVTEWINCKNEVKKIAGYHLLLRLMLGKKNQPDLTALKDMAEKDSLSENFFIGQNACRFLEYCKLYL
jgi:3-methyladenine DNA glycosylase AlkD